VVDAKDVSRVVSIAHVTKGTKLQIGLDLSHGGVCLRCILVIIRFHTLALSTSLCLAELQSTTRISI
jgi:hypothetical protein